MNNDNSLELKNDEALNNDQINLNFILNFFIRNKILISISSITCFIFAALISLTFKRVWEGQFQIVLNTESKESLSFSNPLANLISTSDKNSIKTEVGILKSPSVLLPIFEFVSDRKEKPLEEFSFSNWKKNLKIELEKGTSILNIAYRDKDKTIIIPVLEKISKTYQGYSGRNKKRMQQLQKDYLINQIASFKKKSSESLKAAQEFGLEEDLFYFNYKTPSTKITLQDKDQIKSSSAPPNMGIFPNNRILPNIELESIRVQAANEVRKINLQIDKIKQLGDDTKSLQYIGSTIPALVEEGLPQKLAELEEKLSYSRTIYSEKDISIKEIRKEIDLFVKLLKNRAIGILNARKLESEAIMEAAMRPKGVMLRYKELIREAARDESTLINLENNLRISELEAAKTQDPWELITNPTLLKYPVGTPKKFIALVGLLLGFLGGSFYTFYREKKSGLIFEYEIFKEIFPLKFSESIEQIDLEGETKKILLLKEYINKKANKNKFIFLGKIDKDKIKKLLDLLIDKNNDKFNFDQIFKLEDLKYSFRNQPFLLIVNMNSLKYSEINTLKKYFEEFELEISGAIFLNLKN